MCSLKARAPPPLLYPLLPHLPRPSTPSLLTRLCRSRNVRLLLTRLKYLLKWGVKIQGPRVSIRTPPFLQLQVVVRTRIYKMEIQIQIQNRTLQFLSHHNHIFKTIKWHQLLLLHHLIIRIYHHINLLTTPPVHHINLIQI